MYSHDIHGHSGGQTLTDVFKEVIGGQEVGAARDQVLLELQQLSPPTQKHLRHTHTHTLKSADYSITTMLESDLRHKEIKEIETFVLTQGKTKYSNFKV